jgi:hypothetical protein
MTTEGRKGAERRGRLLEVGEQVEHARLQRELAPAQAELPRGDVELKVSDSGMRGQEDT